MTDHIFYSLIANRDLEQLNHKLAAYRQLAKDAVKYVDKAAFHEGAELYIGEATKWLDRLAELEGGGA